MLGNVMLTYEEESKPLEHVNNFCCAFTCAKIQYHNPCLSVSHSVQVVTHNGCLAGGHKHIPHVVVTRESSLLASMLDGYSLTFVIAAEISTPGSLSVHLVSVLAGTVLYEWAT